MKKEYKEQKRKKEINKLKELLSSYTKKGKYNNMKWLKKRIKNS